jgi:hypothetical protein
MARPLAALLFLAIATAGCGGTSASTAPSAGAASAASSAAASSASPSAEASAAASSSAAASAGPAASASASGATASGGNELVLEAKEYSFTGPTTVAAGVVRIKINNTGKLPHQAQVAKLADSKTVQDVVTALSSGDLGAAFGMLALAGGPNEVPAGSTGTTSQILDAGNYAVLSFTQDAQKVSDFAKGMVTGFTVTGTAAGTLPAGDVQLTLQDFSFVGLDTLTPGKHEIHVTNKGPQSHEAGVLKLPPGMSIGDLQRLAVAASPGPELQAVTGNGGISAIKPGSEATFEVDLPAGNYAFACFVPDPSVGKNHFELGMVTSLTVK